MVEKLATMGKEIVLKIDGPATMEKITVNSHDTSSEIKQIVYLAKCVYCGLKVKTQT